jgi:hypothetical protein
MPALAEIGGWVNYDQIPQFYFGQPHSFYHVGIKPSCPLFVFGLQNQLETYLNTLNGDWFRYAPQNYLIWTNFTSLGLAAGIRNTKGLENLIMLITSFQTDWANGYMPQEFWNWLRKARVPGQKYPPSAT